MQNTYFSATAENMHAEAADYAELAELQAMAESEVSDPQPENLES